MKRIRIQCPASLPQTLSPTQRHSWMGPSGSSERSFKELNALCFLCEQLENEEPECTAARKKVGSIDSQQDPDNGRSIASDWLNAVGECLASWQAN